MTLALNQVKSAVKRKANIDLNSKPGKIIRSTLLPKPEDEIMYSDLSSIWQCIYRVRRRYFPTLPHTIDEAYKQLYEIQENITSNDEQFCFVNQEKNMIIMTCSTNLKLLCDSEYVFGNGTFSYSPKHFVQLYTLHVQKFYVPVAFCFLSSKTTQQYELMKLFIHVEH